MSLEEILRKYATNFPHDYEDSIREAAQTIKKNVIGLDEEGCGNHSAFNLPSEYCSNSKCLSASIINARLNKMRAALDDAVNSLTNRGSHE